MKLKRYRVQLLFTMICSLLIPTLWAQDPDQLSIPGSDFLAIKSTLGDRSLETRSPIQSFQLAVALWRLGEHKAALAITDDLIEDAYAPSATRYLKGLIHLSQVQDVSIFRKLGVAKKAIGAWKAAVDVDPTHVLSNFAVIAFYINAPSFAGGDLDQARGLLPRLKALDPSYSQLAEGLLLAKEDDLEGAERIMLAATKTIQDPPVAWFQLAQLYFQAEQFQKAFDALEKVKSPGLWHYPTPELVFMMQGFAEAQQGRSKEARAAFQAALETAQNPKVKARLEKQLKDLS